MSSAEPPLPAAAPPYVGALLRLAHRKARAQALAGLAAAGFADLQEAYFPIMSYPGPEGMRPTALAQRLGMSKQAANHLLNTLEGLGYLERRDDAEGTRRVHLTARGHAAFAAIQASMRALEQRWAAQIGADRFAPFLATLRDIAALD
jgi:DNA-binding MarR family transcriptional regulator